MKKRVLGMLVLVAAVPAWGQGSEGALRDCRRIAEAAARLACYDAIVLPAAGAAAPATSAAGAGSVPGAKPAAPAERFGLEHKAPPEQVNEIRSRIPGRFEGWRANSRITLENGQVWRVADGSWMGGRWDNPRVTIRRGAFGAFHMHLEDESRTVRVERVK